MGSNFIPPKTLTGSNNELLNVTTASSTPTVAVFYVDPLGLPAVDPVAEKRKKKGLKLREERRKWRR